MDLLAWLASYGPWAWIVGGVILLGLELVVPGGILLWLGISGIVTGLAAMFQPIDYPLQFLIFGGLSLLSIFVWLRYWKDREVPSDRPLLNQRAERLVGRETVLNEPIRNGFGRVAIEDSVWRIAGPDLAAGERVRIVGHDGALLRVEAA